MDEYDPYKDLFEKIMKAKSLDDIGMEEKKILACFQKIIKELYYLKGEILSLRFQLQKSNGTQDNLKEEYEHLPNESKNIVNSSSSANFVTFSSNSNQSFIKLQLKQYNEQIDNLQGKILKLKEENHNLKTHIIEQEAIIEKQSNHFLKKIQKKENEISNLQNELNKLSSTQNKKNKSVNFHNTNLKFEEQQKIRSLFIYAISESSNKMNRMISSLYFALTGNRNNSMRPLILSVLFTLRWKCIKKKNNPFDKYSLMAFASSRSLTFDSRIDTIQNMFKSLTSELSKVKDQLLKNIHTTQKVTHDCNEIESVLNLNQSKYQDLQRQIKFYKSKISELNEEISSMITAEKFEEKLKYFSSIELENDRYKKYISELEEKLEEKNNTIRECKSMCQRAEVQHEIDVEQQKENQNKIDSQKISIDSLNIRLKTRTKDLLSYERMSSNMNKMLFIKQNPVPHENDIDCDFSKENINPKFLPPANS